jgi:deaminated glutathione amidase
MHRIAVAQITSSIDKTDNLALAADLIRQAARQGAQLIAFPEFLMAFSPAAQSAEELAGKAEDVDGPFINAVRSLARECSIGVVATIYERCPVPARVYDTALWVDKSGEIKAVYRKLHLYDAFGFKESDKFAPGDEIAAPIATDAGACGMIICYDLRFPELSRILALSGATFLMAPSGWVKGDMKVDHWQTMIRARALENGCYVIAPDQVGNIYIGHSLVVDPFGRIVLDMEQQTGIALVEIDPAIVAEAREKLPLLKNRRADVYVRHMDTASHR